MRQEFNNPTFIWLPKSGKQDQYKLYAHMLQEDFHLGVLPISGESKNYPDYKVNIEADKIDYEKTIKLLKSLDRSEYRSEPNQLISSVVNNIVLHLMYEGKIYYEIIANEKMEYYLSYFSKERVFSLPRYFIQYIPKVRREKGNKIFVPLAKNKTYSFVFPKRFGGPKKLFKTLRILDKCDITNPKFFMNDFSYLNDKSKFNFSEYVNRMEIIIHKLTNIFGWNKRDHSSKYKTEFYVLYREIGFKWTKSIIREEIINDINKLLMKLKINSKISITGIPSSKDLIEIRNGFIKGEIRLEEITEKIWLE